MNIKTAFRYQNFLSNLSDRAFAKLFSVRITQTELHQKSLAFPEAKDEELIVENEDIENGITAEGCINLIFDIFKEKRRLDKAVAAAKRAADFDL